jgi:hypothetical protein
MAWRLATALAVLVTFGSFAAPAVSADLEFYTGDALYAQCAAKPADPDYALRHARCASYILGVSDAQQAGQGAGAAPKVCLPDTAGSPQLVAAVEAFLETHADKRPLAAHDLVVEALGAQFPCK